MRLTRRGWALVGVVALGVALAYEFGARSLGALVVPCGVALVSAVAQTLRAPEPPLSRLLSNDAEVGTEGVMTLRFDVDDPFPARVRDDLPPGLEGGAAVAAVLGAEPVRYRVRYARRGRHRVGPATVTTTDVLGLVETDRTVGGRDAVLVYPPVRDLPTATLAFVRAEFVDSRSRERDEFDSLREYVRGDALRDIDWKSSAKREDLVVKEFAGTSPRAGIVLVATGANGRGDAMAEAAATVGSALLQAGAPVTLVTADGERTVDPEEREDLLVALATAQPGAVPRRSEADVFVDARRDDVQVRIGGVETTYDRLLSGTVGPPQSSADADEEDGGHRPEVPP